MRKIEQALSDGCNLCHTTKPYLWIPGMHFCIDCRSWADGILYRREPLLDQTPTDTSFINEARNSPEALERWRKWVNK